MPTDNNKLINSAVDDMDTGNWGRGLIKTMLWVLIAVILVIAGTWSHSYFTKQPEVSTSTIIQNSTSTSSTTSKSTVAETGNPCRSGTFTNIYAEDVGIAGMSFSSSSSPCVDNASFKNTPKGIEIRD